MRNIDLNLLRIFEAVYEERSVTRAASRLGLTQSAVSHALSRLRDLLDNPLFKRIPSGLEPTERAHQLAPRLRAALAEIHNAIASPMFDPAATSQRFVISGGSYICTLLAPHLIATMREVAPGISLQFTGVNTQLTHALDQSQVDIALSVFDRVPARFRSEVLFRDQLVWVVGRNSPLANASFDHETFLAQPRVSIGVAPFGDRSNEKALQDDLVSRVILQTDDREVSEVAPMMVPDAASALAVVAATDMIALVPRRYAESGGGAVRVINAPAARVEEIEVSMLWHSRAQDDAGSLWLRQIIRETVRKTL